jgi:DNA-binding MarR family transcriptional regulator
LNRDTCIYIYLRMTVPPVISLPCFCATLRRASRALSQRYDQAMRPLGMTITHFTILQALSLTGEVLQGRLGEILAMDSTTLTRTLAIMSRHGWITTRRGSDRRERWLNLSTAGKAEFKRVLPHWQNAQAQVRTQLGEKRWHNLTSLINELTSVVME